MLVEQQAKALRAWLGPHVSVAEFQGGKALPGAFDVLVSTPDAFRQKQQKESTALGWGSFAAVVFDEVHHVLKDHPYRHIALDLRDYSTRHSRPSPAPFGGASLQANVPRVLGLSASLSYGVTEKKVMASIERLTSELKITHMALATQKEMARDGYCAERSDTEIMCLDSGDEETPGVVPESERKPHLVTPIFWQRVKKNTSTPFAMGLVRLVRDTEAHISQLEVGFKSPLESNKLASWGAYAHKQQVKAKGGARKALYQVLEHLYEALRLLIVGWEEHNAQSIAVSSYPQGALKPSSGFCNLCCLPQMRYLRMCVGSSLLAKLPAELIRPTSSLIEPSSSEQPFRRFQQLKNKLLQEHEQRGEELRAVVFVQQRLVTHILAHLLDSDPELQAAGFRATWIYATSTPATSSFRLSPSDAKTNLELFRDGRANVLLATSAAEEGMDVPKANVTINFDASLTPVSHVQRLGRARQSDSSSIVLHERSDRPTALLQEALAMQNQIVASFTPSKDREGIAERERLAQEFRERSAAALLAAAPPTLLNVLQVLNEYKTKTKARLKCTTSRTGRAEGTFHCSLQYSTCLREVAGSGQATSKKAARQIAAQAVLVSLRSTTAGGSSEA